MSKRKIAASLGVSATACGGLPPAARRAGLGWPLPDDLTGEMLELRLYLAAAVAARDRRPRPGWVALHRGLRRPGVTLQLLWEEAFAASPPLLTATAIVVRGQTGSFSANARA